MNANCAPVFLKSLHPFYRGLQKGVSQVRLIIYNAYPLFVPSGVCPELDLGKPGMDKYYKDFGANPEIVLQMDPSLIVFLNVTGLGISGERKEKQKEVSVRSLRLSMVNDVIEITDLNYPATPNRYCCFDSNTRFLRICVAWLGCGTFWHWAPNRV